MDFFERLMNAIDEERVCNASNLTLGELNDKLENVGNKDLKVKLSTGEFLTNEFDSYRGYYKDIYFEMTNSEENAVTVNGLLESINKAYKQGTMTGYKGGDFDINESVIVWASYYGAATGMKVVDIIEEEGIVTVIIEHED